MIDRRCALSNQSALKLSCCRASMPMTLLPPAYNRQIKIWSLVCATTRLLPFLYTTTWRLAVHLEHGFSIAKVCSYAMFSVLQHRSSSAGAWRLPHPFHKYSPRHLLSCCPRKLDLPHESPVSRLNVLADEFDQFFAHLI